VSMSKVWNMFMLEYICFNEDPSPFITRVFYGLSKEDAAGWTDHVIHYRRAVFRTDFRFRIMILLV
jgi:hypothetical protein